MSAAGSLAPSASSKPVDSPAPSASSASLQSQDGNFALPPADGVLTPVNGEAKRPPAIKKPTMTARISGFFRRDTAESPRELQGRPVERIIENPVAEREASVSSMGSARPTITRKSSQQAPMPAVDAKKNSAEQKPDDPSQAIVPRRFWLTDDEDHHQHYLKVAKRQQKLSDMFKNMLKNKPAGQEEQPLSLMADWISQKRTEQDNKAPADERGGPNHTQTLVQKYGKCQEIVGHGAFGIVRVAHKPDAKDPRREQLYAVKEFRQRPGESAKKYQKRLTSEFCLSSSMQHPNVINTLDLLQDAKGDYCEVMEYCAGGDLYTLILAAGKLEVYEADCYFKQLMRGVDYMHEMGVAHRDLKPENLLLTQHGALKITDFGNGECFRMAWEKEAHMTAGLCGSAPYIAPEEYTDQEFDPRAVDVWACGIIYMAMRTGRHLWKVAQKGEDEFFDRYLEDRKEESGFRPIEVLKRVS